MKHSLRLSVPIMDCQLNSIETVLTGISEVGKAHGRRGQSTLLNTAVIGEYPMAIDLDNKTVRTVDRTSYDRACLIVAVNEIPYTAQHIEWLHVGSEYHVFSVIRFAVANCPWSVEMKRF